MAAWLHALAEHERAGEPAVLVTVLSVRGSAPREAGCKMVVSRDAMAGTIGGGNLEFQCINLARSLLADGIVAPEQKDFPLGPALGQCCGGHVSVLFEPILPVQFHVAIFGAGHVGRALVKLLADLPCQVRWFDNRSDAFLASLPANVIARVVAAPAQEVVGLTAGSFVLVMTHDHQIDFEIVSNALIRDDFLGIGLIGSDTKRARFIARLRRLGLNEAAIGRMICPIGVAGIAGKQPATIAVAVAAQILQASQQRNNEVHVQHSFPDISHDCDGCVRAGLERCA